MHAIKASVVWWSTAFFIRLAWHRPMLCDELFSKTPHFLIGGGTVIVLDGCKSARSIR
jgi:hypothetical protein